MITTKQLFLFANLALAPLFFAAPSFSATDVPDTRNDLAAASLDEYKKLGAVNDAYPSYEVFSLAMQGYRKMKATKGAVQKNIITVIDFSKSSNEKRLWVINLDTRRVLFNDYVAHGRNSGKEFAQTFSNIPNSYMSSIGFYLTSKTYQGKHGLSLRLDGMDGTFNSNARQRAIVMHGADYVSDDFIKKHGRLGRSYGCPAVSMDIYQDLIQTICEGSLLFIYYPDAEYQQHSEILNPKTRKH